MKQNSRVLVIALILLTACSPKSFPPEAPTEEPAATVEEIIPTEPPPTNIPPTPEPPTSTPDALANIDARNPSTFPVEVQEYMKTKQYPSQEIQDRLSKEFFRPLYEKFLLGNGFNETDIKALDYEHLYFQAGKIANEQGFVLPADLSLTRKIAASLQGVSNGIEGGGGIIAGVYRSGYDPTNFLILASTGHNYDLPIFGIDAKIIHSPSQKILIQDGASLFQTANGYVLIGHYFNTSPVDGKTTEHFIPVGVPIGPTKINYSIGVIDSSVPPIIGNLIFSQESPPIDFPGVNDDTLGPGNPFDLNTLLMKLNNASAMTIIVQPYSSVGGQPLSDDALELATSMYINQKSAQSP